MVVIGRFEVFDDSACAEIRAADADDQKHVAVFADAFRASLDASVFFAVNAHAEVAPSEKIVTLAAFLAEIFIRLGKKTVKSGKIAFLDAFRLLVSEVDHDFSSFIYM